MYWCRESRDLFFVRVRGKLYFCPTKNLIGTICTPQSLHYFHSVPVVLILYHFASSNSCPLRLVSVYNSCPHRKAMVQKCYISHHIPPIWYDTISKRQMSRGPKSRTHGQGQECTMATSKTVDEIASFLIDQNRVCTTS